MATTPTESSRTVGKQHEIRPPSDCVGVHCGLTAVEFVADLDEQVVLDDRFHGAETAVPFRPKLVEPVLAGGQFIPHLLGRHDAGKLGREEIEPAD